MPHLDGINVRVVSQGHKIEIILVSGDLVYSFDIDHTAMPKALLALRQAAEIAFSQRMQDQSMKSDDSAPLDVRSIHVGCSSDQKITLQISTIQGLPLRVSMDADQALDLSKALDALGSLLRSV